MPQRTRSLFKASLIVLIALFWVMATLQLLAQEPAPQIEITGNDVTNPPAIVLLVTGRDSEGNAIDFSREPLVLTHNGVAVTPNVEEVEPVGTFTVILVDTTTGVSEQIPAMQDAIKQFASSSGGMQEQVDALAIYQVGESGAQQLLAPTQFYNSVQNYFVDDMQPITGTTALIDSMASVIDQIERLKPDPNMTPFLVVMSDGTDAISTLTAEEIFTKTADIDLPIHTVWVSSADLTPAGQQQGIAFLEDLSNATRGTAVTLDDQPGISNIWQKIAGFRNHARVSYLVEELAGGAYDVDLSLANVPAVRAATTVVIPENQPQVSIDLPVNSREWTLPDLENPLPIRLSTIVSWLDGEERAVTSARLRVNGVDVAEIPVEELDQFTAEVSNFAFGDNTVEVTIEDEQGLRASNVPVVINIAEGDRNMPSEVQPSSGLGRTLFNILLLLLAVALIAGIIYWFMHRGGGVPGLPRGRSERNRQSTTVVSPVPEEESVAAPVAPAPYAMAQLEVLEAATQMDGSINLGEETVRIGRSPTQADVAFREDITMSRLHASLMREGDHYRIFDENSTSGTWVNGRQVPDYGLQLADGDEINLGAVLLRFRQL